MSNANIVLAGATGALGSKIARSLIERNANVRALVRNSTAIDKIFELQELGATVIKCNFNDLQSLAEACKNADCVVSALSGLSDVTIDTQSNLLDAAIKAGVPRFIPSDYCLDFTRMPAGRNRNLDLRREFHKRLDKAPIAVTSIFNSAFTELLTGEAPFILFKIKKILCWGSPNQSLDFSTMDNVADFTAQAALDENAPRKLHIASDRLTSRDLAKVVSDITNKNFTVLRAGSLNTLGNIIKFTRLIMPAKDQLYPAWQGMQYMRDMFSGLAQPELLDNNRYPEIKWISVRDYLNSQKI